MAELTVRGLRLSTARPRVVVPLYATALPEILRQAAAAQNSPAADLAELRLDPLPTADYAAAVAAVRAAVQKPLLVTIRTAREGGEAELTPAAYAALCTELLKMQTETPAFDLLDLEWSTGPALLAELSAAAKTAGVVTVYSSHNFAATPPTAAMTELLTAMADAGAGIAKLAVMPQSLADAARLLEATAAAAALRPATPLLTMSMGRHGEITRFCGGRFGSVATFGTLGTASAPGQPDAARLAAALDLLAE